MENYPQRNGSPLMLPEIPLQRWRSEDNPLEECRSLVRILAKKTETLYRECRHDRDKATHIQAMGTTLAALTVMVNKLDDDSRILRTPEILEDARGIIYESVRSCELNRICDK
jgi:hypothetical protein